MLDVATTSPGQVSVIDRAAGMLGSAQTAAALPYATFAAGAVLTGMIGYTLASLLWQALPVETTRAPAVSMEPRASATADRPDRGRELAAMGLLGRAEPLERAAVVPVNAPETRLNLTLRGLYYSARQESAMAIIGAGNNSETFYRVGDNLPGGATISAIHADRVILMRSGRHETLTLPDQRLQTGSTTGGGASPAASRTAAVGGSDGTDFLPGATEDEPGQMDQMDQMSGSGPGVDLPELRREMVRNPASIGRYLSTEAVSEDGVFQGFRLSQGEDHSLMQATGLEPGDVVTGINGNAIDSQEAGMRAMRSMARSETVELEILRNGSPRSISIDLTN